MCCEADVDRMIRLMQARSDVARRSSLGVWRAQSGIPESMGRQGSPSKWAWSRKGSWSLVLQQILSAPQRKNWLSSRVLNSLYDYLRTKDMYISLFYPLKSWRMWWSDTPILPLMWIFFFFYEILTKLKSTLSSPTESEFTHLWSITEQLFNFLNSENDTDIISGVLLAAPSLGT